MAYMYTPFYAIAQVVAIVKGHRDDGYSKLTQKILVLGIWIYVCIGLFFLGKALFRFFPSRIVITTLTMLLVSTNLIWYINGEALFPHGVNFMWLSILIYSTIKYHQQQKLFYILFGAFSISLLALIRPNNILLGFFPILYGIYNRESFFNKIKLLRANYVHLIFAFIIFIVPIIPQFIYWKYATSYWIYYSYQGEKFYWSRPLIIDVLFSFRKGWLIYTPVMSLSIVGLFYLRKKVKEIFLPAVFIFFIFLYITSCWWAWSYGGCYGMRPMIDIYAILAFPFAAIMFKRKWFTVVPIVIFLIICTRLNIFQLWQYNEGILHYDQMNKETYFSIWRKIKYPIDYDLTISYPDYEREMAGKTSFYNLNELTEYEFSMKFIRAKFICSLDSNHVGIGANHANASGCDAFNFIFNAAEKKYYIRSYQTGLYFSCNEQTGTIMADERDKLKAGLFEFVSLGHNKFAIKAPNWLFVTSTEQNNFILKAESAEVCPDAYVVFRKYIH